MALITLSRQLGAGGSAIGRELAQRLGAEYLDRELVARVAARSGILEAEAAGYDEQLPGPWQRLAAALAASSPEETLPSVMPQPAGGPEMSRRLFAITRTIVEEAAASGNAVLVGRGAGFILEGRPALLRVHLHASLDARVAYLAAHLEELPPNARPDDASLRQFCASFDRARASYLRRHFGVDWNDARHYDLALDTGRLGLTRCVELIELAAREQAAWAGSPTR